MIDPKPVRKTSFYWETLLYMAIAGLTNAVNWQGEYNLRFWLGTILGAALVLKAKLSPGKDDKPSQTVV